MATRSVAAWGGAWRYDCHTTTPPGGALHRHAATRAAATRTLRAIVAGWDGRGDTIAAPPRPPGGAPHRPRAQVPRLPSYRGVG